MERIPPLIEVLRRTRHGRGIVQVDREYAKAVWWALRGGWHYHVTRTGAPGGIPKNIHSHPGDAMSYGASLLFPQGKLSGKSSKHAPSAAGATTERRRGSIRRGRP